MSNIDIRNFATSPQSQSGVIPTCKECGRQVRPGWGIKCSVCGIEPICRRHGSGLMSIPYVCTTCKQRQQTFLNAQPKQADALFKKISLAEKSSKEDFEKITQEILNHLGL